MTGGHDGHAPLPEPLDPSATKPCLPVIKLLYSLYKMKNSIARFSIRFQQLAIYCVRKFRANYLERIKSCYSIEKKGNIESVNTSSSIGKC